MVGVPLIVFNFIKNYYFDILTPDEDMWAGIAAVISVQFVIFGIIIWKYTEDIKLAMSDEADEPYDKSLKRITFKKIQSNEESTP